MKDFGEFISSIKQEDIEQMIDEFNKRKVTVSGSDVNEIFNSSFNASAQISVKLTLGLLKLYHEWLNSEN